MLKSVGTRNTVTGNQTITGGDLIIGTAGEGVAFTGNTPAAGMSGQTLNWYEEGVWTPTDASGAALTFSAKGGFYTRIGRMVMIQAVVVYPVTASGADSLIGGLPFTPNGGPVAQGRAGAAITVSSVVTQAWFLTGNDQIYLYKPGAVRATNVELSTQVIYFSGTYTVA